NRYLSDGVKWVRRLTIKINDRSENGRVDMQDQATPDRGLATIDKDPQESDSILQRANELWHSERHDFALKTVNVALLKNSKDAQLWSWLSEKYDALGEQEASALCVRNAVDSNPGDVKSISALIDKAAEREWKGETTRAYKRLVKAIK